MEAVAQTDPSNAATSGQQWEYVRVFCALNAAGRTVVNGTSLGLSSHTVVVPGTDVDTAVAQLGQERWELAGTSGDAKEFQLFFKRPKSRGI